MTVPARRPSSKFFSLFEFRLAFFTTLEIKIRERSIEKNYSFAG